MAKIANNINNKIANNIDNNNKWNFDAELAKLRAQAIKDAIKEGATVGKQKAESQPLHLRKVYKTWTEDGVKHKVDTGRRAIKLGKTASVKDWGAYKGLTFKDATTAVAFINKAYSIYNNMVAQERKHKEQGQ